MSEVPATTHSQHPDPGTTTRAFFGSKTNAKFCLGHRGREAARCHPVWRKHDRHRNDRNPAIRPHFVSPTANTPVVSGRMRRCPRSALGSHSVCPYSDYANASRDVAEPREKIDISMINLAPMIFRTDGLFSSLKVRSYNLDIRNRYRRERQREIPLRISSPPQAVQIQLATCSLLRPACSRNHPGFFGTDTSTARLPIDLLDYGDTPNHHLGRRPGVPSPTIWTTTSPARPFLTFCRQRPRDGPMCGRNRFGIR